MKNNKSKKIGGIGNGPDWYFQGLAAKLAGTNLTWTGVKQSDTYPFVAACGLATSLMIPLAHGSIHPQVKANVDIEFQALRGKNTGAYNYGPREVFLYDWQMSSCIAFYRYIRKLIAISNSADPQVPYLAQKLYATAYPYNTPLTSKQVYDDMILNKSLYVTRLNSIGKVINSLAYKGRTLNSRWNYLADKCIKDYNGDKAIYGIYLLSNIPYVDTNDNDSIKYFNTESIAISALMDKLESMVNDLQSEIKGDYAKGVLLKVAGDMIKLLGASAETFDNVPYLDGTEKLSFDYDAEAIDQIRNAKCFPVYGTPTQLTDTELGVSGQKVDSLVSVIATSNSTNINNPQTISILGPDARWLMTSDRNKERSVKENIQMSQFMLDFKIASATPATSVNVEIEVCGTSSLSYMTIVMADVTNDPRGEKFAGIVSVYNGTNTAHLKFGGLNTLHGTSGNAYTEWINTLVQIDFCPRFQLAFVNSTGSYQYADWLDIDNYAYETNWQYEQFNNIAVYSQTFVFTPDQVKIASLLE